MRFLHGWFALLGVMLSSACEDSYSKGWFVDRTRVLGARVEATAEPSRSSLAPGEAARIAWLVGAPNGTRGVGWAFATCASPPGFLPVPRCAKGALTSGRGRGDSEVVVMNLTAPAAGDLGDASEIMVLAAFCEAGDPTLEPTRFEATCSEGSAPLLASLNVRTIAAGVNQNPEIAVDAVTFDGAPLTASTPVPEAGCATSPEAAGRASVVAGTEHAFGFDFRGDEREPGASETLILSSVVTSGELDRQYSAHEVGDPAPKRVTIPWTSPPRDQIGEGGRLVEAFFVLRDGRGGTAFARRTVCVRRDP